LLKLSSAPYQGLAYEGKREVVRTLWAKSYEWFTEGFDTTDLQEAKGLLETLGTMNQMRLGRA
jgi:hypothetical protein